MAEQESTPAHELAYVSQDFDRWRSVCRCGWHDTWSASEREALLGCRIHQEPTDDAEPEIPPTGAPVAETLEWAEDDGGYADEDQP